MTDRRHVAVIGGGIIGLAVADRLTTDHPGWQVTVVEKEDHWAAHQTGRNSGVIHSGIYYAPGSLKAQMCRAGNASMFEFAERHGIGARRTGKLIVATSEDQVARLALLRDRGRANGLDVTELDADQAREWEPHVSCLRALRVASTGVVDFAAVCSSLAADLAERGADLRPSTSVRRIIPGPHGAVLETDRGDLEADLVVNCAGLHSDELARTAGARPTARIVPFRGEYYTVAGLSAGLIRGLVYPVPDPALPFLGVHLTRGTGGTVHAGPNAVLALAREGYRWTTVHPRELAATLAYPGLWRLASRHARTAVEEVLRSLSRRRFADSLRTLVPDLREEDLVPAPAGVRAQAITRDGTLVDDFLIEREGACVHVLNAPSPAATSAFEIARHIVSLV